VNARVTVGSVYTVVGVSHPLTAAPQVIIDSPDVTVRLGRDADGLCPDLDTASVVGGMMMRGLFGDGGRDPHYKFDDGLRHAITDLRGARRDQVLLIIETRSDVTLDLTQVHREHSGLVAGFDLFDSSPHRKRHDDTVADVIAAVTIAAGQGLTLHRVTMGTSSRGDDGKTYLSYTITANPATVTLSQPLQAPGAVAQTVSRLGRQRKHLSDIVRLLAQASVHERPFDAWLAAWTALEMFIHQRAKFYERQFFAKLATNADPITGVYFERVQEVMEGRHRLTDHFRMMAVFLSPNTAAADIQTLSELNKIRQKLLHRGEHVADHLLRTSDIKNLLRRYLEADLVQPQN